MGSPTNPAILRADAAWCATLFKGMREGTIWAVPRCGLMFTRRGDELVLTARMPWTPELEEAAKSGLDVPKSAAELDTYQELEFELIRDRFERARITVRKENTDGQ